MDQRPTRQMRANLMKKNLTAVAKAVSGAVALALLPQVGSANLILDAGTKTFSQDRNFSHTRTSSATGTTSTTVNTPRVALSGGSFNGFDANTGVLKGVSITTPTGSRNMSIRVQGINGTVASNTAIARQQMTSLSLSDALSGGSSQTVSGTTSFAPGPTNATTVNCTAASGAGCTSTIAPINPAQTGNATLTTAWTPTASNTYVGGAGHVTLYTNFTAQTFAGNNGTGFSTQVGTSTANWSGSVNLKYDYVAHANADLVDVADPTQSVNTVSFGTWLVGAGDSPESLQYAVQNTLRNGLTTANQNELKLVSATATSGDTGVLTTNATTADLSFNGGINPIVAGDNRVFDADFDTTNSGTGSFTAQYTLLFADQTPNDGAAPNSTYWSYQTAGQESAYTKTLTLTGALVEHSVASFEDTARNAPVIEKTIDFGHVSQGLSPESFTVFNLLGSLSADEVVDLKFLGCTPSGDDNAFSVDLCGMTGTIINPSHTGLASNVAFTPTGPGHFTATYVLEFVEYAPDLHGYDPILGPPKHFLTLTVTGVPEPGSLALMGAGLLGFGLRRKQKA